MYNKTMQKSKRMINQKFKMMCVRRGTKRLLVNWQYSIFNLYIGQCDG